MGEVKWRAPGVPPQPGTRVLWQKQTAGPCRSPAINQALKQDTPSYHGITQCRQKRLGLFLRPGAPLASSEYSSHGKLHGSSSLSRFSRALIHCVSKAAEWTLATLTCAPRLHISLWSLHVEQSKELFRPELLAEDTRRNLIWWHCVQTLWIDSRRVLNKTFSAVFFLEVINIWNDSLPWNFSKIRNISPVVGLHFYPLKGCG